MRLLVCIAALIGTAFAPEPTIVLAEHPHGLVCAEYTSPSAPREANRSCVEAAQVRAWILMNGRPDECGDGSR